MEAFKFATPHIKFKVSIAVLCIGQYLIRAGYYILLVISARDNTRGSFKI